MNSEIKYPYIGKSKIGSVALFLGEKTGLSIDSPEIYGRLIDDWNEENFTNITHEYLSNTWGLVESKEHAESIVELARLHGVSVNESISENPHKARTFRVYTSGLAFHQVGESEILTGNCKQITIPLPPKESVSVDEWVDEISIAADELTQSEEFELHQKQAVQEFNSDYYDKHNINGTMKCNIAKPSNAVETWPQVGDPVTFFGQQGVLVLPADKNGMYVVESNGSYFIPKLSDMTKPKTAQDIAIEELQTKLCELNAVDNYILACEIVTGGVEGLVYQGCEMSDTGESK